MGSATVWVLVGAVVVVAVMARLARRGMASHVDSFLRDGDVGALVGRIEALPPATQPTAYHSALLRTWATYERRRAMELIREMGMRVGDASIAQYWIRQALEVEPEIAREVLDEDWLSAFYVPEVAKQCGSFG